MRTLMKTAMVTALLAATPAFADEPGPGGSKPPMPKTGEETYRMICQSCHMPDGKGAVGAGAGYPALANNPRLAAAPYPILMVLKGKGAMPWFGDSLNAQQVAEVVTYIRTHFGNGFADAVTADQVKALAPAHPADAH